jgi:hypothetical protein
MGPENNGGVVFSTAKVELCSETAKNPGDL